MKKFKKLVALILVGVMAMAMLTACGGGGGGSKSFATEVEDAVFAVYSQAFGVKTNDAEAKKLAQTALGYVKDGKFYEKDFEDHCITVDEAKYQIMIAMPIPDADANDNYNYYTVMEITPEMLAQLNSADIPVEDIKELNEMLKKYETMGFKVTGLGVAAKTINGKTYAAFGIKMEIDINKLPQ